MTIQLQLNQGPQDALLYDNNRSFFAATGYLRTSNFQMEYRDIDSQNTASWNSTTTFVIPQAGDLLGNLDAVIDLGATQELQTALSPAATSGDTIGWVPQIGYAMIESVTLTVGQLVIQEITGAQLQLENEFQRDPDYRYSSIIGQGDQLGSLGGFSGKPGELTGPEGMAADGIIASAEVAPAFQVGDPIKVKANQLIVPLGLFFSKHPANYFPMTAIATCNEVKVAIKWRDWRDLYQLNDRTGGTVASTTAPSLAVQLRAHYVHVTGVEAQLLASKEHVRLLNLTQRQTAQVKLTQGQTATKHILGG